MDCEARFGGPPLEAPDPSSFHSRYAPEREAARHVRARIGSRRPAIVYVIGGGLGYIHKAVAELLPTSRVVSLQPCDSFYGYQAFEAPIEWRPGGDEPLESVLARSLADGRLAGGVSVIEWAPVTKRYPAQSERIRLALRDALESASSDAATSAYWPAAWLRNAGRFASAARREARLASGSGTVVIACAGPSLARYMPELKRRRDDIAVWALASAVPALVSAGLTPDLALATDPGFWNALHLRSVASLGIPLAVTPSAYATEDAIDRCPIIALDTGLPFERAAVEASGFYGLRCSASGSAAGTALSLALSCTSGPVALAGYDLAAFGPDDHCRPYPFDSLDRAAASRTRPESSARAARTLDGYQAADGGWRVSRAFTAYASSIRPPVRYQGRAFRLSESPVPTPLPRVARLEDVPLAPGAPPAVRAPDSVPLETVAVSRAERLEAYFDRVSSLLDASLADAREALAGQSPMPFDAMTVYRALAGEASAPLVASMARGESSERELLAVHAKASAALRSMRGGSGG